MNVSFSNPYLKVWFSLYSYNFAKRHLHKNWLVSSSKTIYIYIMKNKPFLILVLRINKTSKEIANCEFKQPKWRTNKKHLYSRNKQNINRSDFCLISYTYVLLTSVYWRYLLPPWMNTKKDIYRICLLPICQTPLLLPVAEPGIL